MCGSMRKLRNGTPRSFAFGLCLQDYSVESMTLWTVVVYQTPATKEV